MEALADTRPSASPALGGDAGDDLPPRIFPPARVRERARERVSERENERTRGREGERARG